MANVTVNGVWYSTAYSGWMHTTRAAFAGRGTSNTGDWYNYRTKIKFTTGSFGGKYKKLIVSATPNQNSSPGYTTAVLTKKEIADDKILDVNTMQSDKPLADATIASSYAYTSTSKTAYAGTNNKNKLYYVLDTDIEEGTTYYLYIRRGGPSGQGNSGFVGFNISSLSVELPATSFVPNQYQVKFDSNGGREGVIYRTVKCNSTYGELPQATRNGHRFLGWYTAKSGGSPITSETKTLTSTSADATITLYAHWGKDDYTITIDANGGKYDNNVPSGALTEGKYSYKYDSKISIAAPTKPGYLLAAWWTTPRGYGQIQQPIGYAISQYTSEDRGNFSKTIKEKGYTNYKWTGISSKSNLTWNYVTIAKYPVSKDETITISGLIRVNENSSKVALNLYHGASHNDWQNCKWSTTEVSGWKRFIMTRTFHTTTTAYFEIFTGPLQNVSGNIDFDLQAISISRGNGQVVPTEMSIPGENVYIKSIWTPITYYLKYDSNGGIGNMEMQTVSYGTYTYLRENKFTRSGHTFKGWHVSRASDGKWLYATPNNISTEWYELGKQPEGQILRLFNFGNASGHDTEVMNDILTYHAQWEKHIILEYWIDYGVKVTFGTTEFNNPYEYCEIMREKYLYGDTLSIGLLNPDVPERAFKIERKGYNYTRHWQTKTGKIIRDLFAGSAKELAERLGHDPTESDGVIKLYPKWDPIRYNITYDLNGGKLWGSIAENYQTTVAYDSRYSLLNSSAVTKWGYKLARWQATYTDDFGNKYITNLDPARSFTWKYTSNLELRAIWEPVMVGLKFYYGKSDHGELIAQYKKGFNYNDELPSVKDMFETACMPHHKMIGWKCYNPDNGEYYTLPTDKTAAWNMILELATDSLRVVDLLPIIEPRYKILYIDSEGNEKRLAMIMYKEGCPHKIYPYFKKN